MGSGVPPHTLDVRQIQRETLEKRKASGMKSLFILHERRLDGQPWRWLGGWVVGEGEGESGMGVRRMSSRKRLRTT
jgi:hypothetical protein